MTDVLLTHSYHLYYDRKQTRKMQPYPPLGTLYAAAVLRSAGLSVSFFDTMLNDPESGFESALEQHRPRIVVVYEDSFNFLTKMCLTRMREVAYDILEVSQKAGAVVFVNGSDASDHAVDYLHKGFRCVLMGEAEATLLEVVQQLLRGNCHALRQIPGLAFLDDGAEEVIRTARRSPMRDLDSLPFPARDLIEADQYRSAWKTAHGYFSLNIVASRGCPYRCNWCAKPIYGDSFAVRSVNFVAEEMRRLKYEFGAEHLWFADDIFGLRAKWVNELAEQVEKLDAALPFKMQSRVDLMTGQRTRFAPGRLRGGLDGRRIGFAEDFRRDGQGNQSRAVRDCPREPATRRNSGLLFPAVRIPRRDLARHSEDGRAGSHTQPDDIGVSVSYPLPGTKFFERVKMQIGEKSNWSDSEDLSMMFQGAYTDEFYHALHDALHAQVDSWSSRSSETAQERNAASNPEELWQSVTQLEQTCRNARAHCFGKPCERAAGAIANNQSCGQFRRASEHLGS